MNPIPRFSQVLQGILLFTLLAVGSSGKAEDWPLARANAAGTGATIEQVVSEPSLLWEHSVGGAGFEGTPIIAEGAVFVADVDGRVLCLELSSGKVKWERKLETGFIAAGGYHAKRFFVGDYDGTLYAFDSESGKDLWTFKTEAQIDAGATFFEDKVLVTSEDGSLYCVSQSEGKLQWKYETGDQLRCGASLAGNRTFLGGCDGKLHIVDVAVGKSARDPLPLEGPTGSTPSVDGNTVFVPTHGGDLFAFDAVSGMQKWHFKDPKLAQEFQNSVAISSGLVIAASQNRRVFALRASTGERVWDAPIRKRADSSPVIAGDKILITATDGRIVMLDLQTGRELWMFEVKGGFVASPAVSAGRIVVASDKGTIYCFGAR